MPKPEELDHYGLNRPQVTFTFGSYELGAHIKRVVASQMIRFGRGNNPASIAEVLRIAVCTLEKTKDKDVVYPPKAKRRQRATMRDLRRLAKPNDGAAGLRS